MDGDGDGGNVVPLLGAGVRLPPSNAQAEQALLGAIMASPNALAAVEEFLKPEYFVDPVHQRIFGAAAKRIHAGGTADAVTLRGEFDEAGILREVGGMAYLATLQSAMISVRYAAEYGRAIRDAWVHRQMIDLGTDLVNQAFDPSTNVEALIAESHARSLALLEVAEAGNGRNRAISFIDAADRALMAADKAMQAGAPVGLSTGMASVDKVLGGLEPGTLNVLAGRPGSGKAQPLDAKVLMADGSWSLMGDLCRGDRLASVDGEQSRVIEVHPRGRREVFRVTLSDGRSTEVCADHVWRVRYRDWPAPRVLSTETIRTMLARKRYRGRLFVERMSGDFGDSRRTLPLDPYVLGVLLGDGCLRRRTANFTSFDAEIVEEVQFRLGLHCKVTRSGDRQAYSIASGGRTTNSLGQFKSAAWLPDVLTDLGLMGLRSEEKFIPPQYFFVDRKRRLDLLRGLMDTDGTVSRQGAVSFASSSRALAEGVQRLVRSLGGLCAIALKRPFYTHKGERREGLPSFQCNIRHPHGEIFFLLPRKSSRAIRGHNATVSLTISSISPTRIAETRCITVSHPSRLYVADEFTVTHNSSLGVQWGINAARSGSGVLIFSLEMSAAALARRALASLSGVPISRLRSGQHAGFTDELIAARRQLADLPLWIHEGGRMSMVEIAARAGSERRKHKVGLIVVDHMHLVRYDDTSMRRGGPTAAVADIAHGMQGLAKQLECPVLLLAQLNRGPLARDDHRPTMSDLRQSGAIEEDADTVMFVYRPELHLPKSAPRQDEGESASRYEARIAAYHDAKERDAGVAELICDKVREGEPRTVQLRFNGPTATFSEPAS